MSTGKGGGTTSHKTAYEHSDQHERQTTSSNPELSSPPRREDDPTSTTASASPEDERGSTPQRDQPSEGTYPSTEETPNPSPPRQVIAVSASKGPAAFFNLARKFLVTDETCDLSALEGAIVSAVDAAHLLERSKLATIVRVQTSYVTVEPKRRKQAPANPALSPVTAPTGSAIPPTFVSSSTPQPAQTPQARRGASGRELRRARIVITVKRTESYKRWLEENPLQAMIAGDGDEELAEGPPTETQATK